MSNLPNGSRWQIALINIYDCNHEFLRDPEYIKEFAKKICEVIDMQRYWEALLKRFWTWDLEGYSMIQFIETSSITVHLDEFGNRWFIDIFSCKEFDSQKAEEFCKQYFAWKSSKCQTIHRI